MCFTRLPLKAGYGISPLQCYICFNRLTLVERVIELDIFQNQSLYENPISAIQRQKKKKKKTAQNWIFAICYSYILCLAN